MSAPADPRYVSESWADALERVPALSEFVGVALDGYGAARALDLVDTLPGFDLFHVWFGHGHTKSADFIFRRAEPSIDAAVAAEREECALVAEDGENEVSGRGYHDQLGDARLTMRNIAAAIRTRGAA